MKELAEAALAKHFPAIANDTRSYKERSRINTVQMEADIQAALELDEPAEVRLWLIDAIVCHHCQRGTVFNWGTGSSRLG